MRINTNNDVFTYKFDVYFSDRFLNNFKIMIDRYDLIFQIKFWLLHLIRVDLVTNKFTTKI